MLRLYSFLVLAYMCYMFIILLGDARLITIILVQGSTGVRLCTCKIRETKRP